MPKKLCLMYTQKDTEEEWISSNETTWPWVSSNSKHTIFIHFALKVLKVETALLCTTWKGEKAQQEEERIPTFLMW